jgi:hypothetical protein
VQRHATPRPIAWSVFVVLLGVGIALLSRFPHYTGANAKFPGSLATFAATPYGQAITWWLEHPFQRVPTETLFPESVRSQALNVGAMSHCDKLAFRALLPLVNQVFGGGVRTLVVANHLAVLLTFFLIYRLCRRISSDPGLASFAVWAYAASWAGSWGFNDWVFGDAVAVALLLGAMAARQAGLAGALVLLAGFVDERAILAAPLVAVFRAWADQPPFAAAPVDLRRSWAVGAPVVAGIAGYVAIRFLAAWQFNLATGTTMMANADILLYHFYVSYPIKLFGVFELLWAAPLLVLLHAALSGPAGRSALPVFGFALLLAAAPAFLVWDVDRSLCYLLPGIVTAISFLPGEATLRRRLILAASAGSLLWLEPNVSAFRFFVF